MHWHDWFKYPPLQLKSVLIESIYLNISVLKPLRFCLQYLQSKFLYFNAKLLNKVPVSISKINSTIKYYLTLKLILKKLMRTSWYLYIFFRTKYNRPLHIPRFVSHYYYINLYSYSCKLRFTNSMSNVYCYYTVIFKC